MSRRRSPPSRSGRVRSPDLEAIASRWQQALDAADRAIASLPPAEQGPKRRELAAERQETAEALARSARAAGVPVPWLSAVPITRAMLGLPAGTRACLFDLDGVLTDSGELHAWAWAVVFDDFLLRLSDKTGWHFIPFDRDADYRAYVDGRPRLEAVHAFLESRGIHVPEGGSADPAHADTAQSLARHKGDVVARALRSRDVHAVPGARRYLEAAGRVGVARGVVSASANTVEILEHAGLDDLIDDRIDADVLRAGSLQAPPAPDVPLAACRRLGVAPHEAVAFTHSAAGAAAARAAGLMVVAVAGGVEDALGRLRAADVTVPTLAALLDPRIAARG
jgi:beta-phosphoglucomutase-like phosphatase (HAD superfamily)